MKETNEERNIEALISGLGVFELRGVARQLGVSSPTTKKREQLIALIQEAINNGATIKDSNPKRGRPFKKLNVLDSITDRINNEVIKLDFSNVKNTMFFAQEMPEPLAYDEFTGIILKYNHSIELHDIARGYVAKIENTEELYRLLETGDKVRANVNMEDNKYTVTKILEVNGVDFKNYKSRFVDKGCAIIDRTEIPFAQGKAIVGRRNLFRLEMPLFETDYIQKLASYCEKEGYVLIVLAVNTMYENDIMLKNMIFENKFFTSYGADSKTNYHKIISAINYAENLVDRGKKVVFFTADIIEDLRALEKYFALPEKEEDEYEDATMIITNKLLKFARSFERGCSGTLIMCYNEIDANDKFLNNDILKISQKIN